MRLAGSIVGALVLLACSADTTPHSNSGSTTSSSASSGSSVGGHAGETTGGAGATSSSSAYLGQYQGQQIVAAALIAGDATAAYNGGGCKLLDQVAYWAFHGDADSFGQPGDGNSMAKFKACPPPHKDVQYTIIAGADHPTSWTVVYDLSHGEDIYAWLLAQSR